MTEPTALIVVVTDDFSQAERVRSMLTAARYRVLTVADFETAGMRIAGGGVDMVVMRLSMKPRGPSVRESIASLKKLNPELPVMLLCDGDPAQSQAPLTAPVVGEAELLSTVRAFLEPQARKFAPAEDREFADRPSGAGGSALLRPSNPKPASTRIISVQGAKGGVGASTVALNLATLLAGHGKTILAEIRPGLGTLASHFRLRRKCRTLGDLMASVNAITAADLEDYLWPCQEIPGLSILFAPPSFGCDFNWSARIGQALRAAAGIADYVVVDLPHCFSEVHRAALRVTDYFLLVLERDPLCLQAGKLMLGAIESENLLPHAAAAVAVARVSLAAPLDLSEVERELSLPVLGYVPPDPDLCLRAYQAQTAVVLLDPESILAGSYARMVVAFPAALRLGQPQPA